jgi:hypothetical protein
MIQLRQSWAVAKSSGILPFWMAIGLALLAGILVGPHAYSVFGRSAVFSPLWPMAAWVPSIGVGALLPIKPVWLRSSARGCTPHMLVHLVSSLLAVGVVGATPSVDRMQMVRAVCCFLGIGAGVAAIVDENSGCWVPGLICGIGMWILGSTTAGPEDWAFLYRSDIGFAGSAACFGVFLLGEAALFARLEWGTQRRLRAQE